MPKDTEEVVIFIVSQYSEFLLITYDRIMKQVTPL